MNVNENKAVVREFVSKVLVGRDLSMIDKLLAPNYMNHLGNVDLAGFKAMLSNMKAAIPTQEIEIDDIVGEGDSVVIRGKIHITFADGKKTDGRIITYYRLENGKIVEDDPISTPDLGQILSNIAPSK